MSPFFGNNQPKQQNKPSGNAGGFEAKIIQLLFKVILALLLPMIALFWYICYLIAMYIHETPTLQILGDFMVYIGSLALFTIAVLLVVRKFADATNWMEISRIDPENPKKDSDRY